MFNQSSAQMTGPDDTNNLISSISLAVCSILLSLTGFMVALHRSRCKTIDCCGVLKCDRVITEGRPTVEEV